MRIVVTVMLSTAEWQSTDHTDHQNPFSGTQKTAGLHTGTQKQYTKKLADEGTRHHRSRTQIACLLDPKMHAAVHQATSESCSSCTPACRCQRHLV